MDSQIGLHGVEAISSFVISSTPGKTRPTIILTPKMGVISFNIGKERHEMANESGQKDRPGAGSFSLEMRVEGIPVNCYLNHHPVTGRAEIVKMMPPSIPDRVVKDFSDEDSAWAWLRTEYRMRRIGNLMSN
jgi:hypothetical protein